ncbi:hypothetical protein JNL27_14470 [bacterium]|nr:hypothetical protein [bacterium]
MKTKQIFILLIIISCVVTIGCSAETSSDLFVQGTVTSAVTGDSIAEANIDISEYQNCGGFEDWDCIQLVASYTDSNGHYGPIHVILDGNFAITASKEGFLTKSASLSPGRHTINIVLIPTN